MADVVTFDPVNLRIVEISAGDDNELDLVEVYSEWKDWLLADPSRMGYPPAFRQVGSDPISPTQNLGTTFFLLNGWRIRPAELSHKLTIVGNVFTDPSGFSVFVNTLGAFTVNAETRVSNLVDSVLVNSPDIQYASFNGGVWVDLVNGTPGTEYPQGTQRAPVDNFTDALAVAAARGFVTLFIVGHATIGGALDYSNFFFVGQSRVRSHLIVDAAANVAGAEFSNATITGTLDGGATISNCDVQALNFVDGTVQSCVLFGPITLSGGNDAHFLDCWAGNIGGSPPVIDLGGSGSGLALRNYSGAVTLQNKSGVESVVADMASGLLTLGPTITAGTITVRGVGSLVNNSVGATVDSTGLLNPTTAAGAVWKAPRANLVTADSAGLTLLELFRLAGLDPTRPLVVTKSGVTVSDRDAGAEIHQDVADTATETTVTRS
jgi:hypothetical protein